MTPKEKILKLPVWKAGVLFLLIGMIILFSIEEIFISRIFNIFDKKITHFEKVFKEEVSEYDRDYQENKEWQAYKDAESDIMRLEFQSDLTSQSNNCVWAKLNKLREKLLDMPYVQKNPETKQRIIKMINDNKNYISAAIKDHRFDPSRCEVQ